MTAEKMYLLFSAEGLTLTRISRESDFKNKKMFYKKLTAVFCCAAIFIAQSFAQTRAVSSVDENKAAPVIAPEVREKSVALLNALAREAEQFSLPENRVRARVLTANLLWEPDEKQARRGFQASISELNSMIGQLSVNQSDEDQEDADENNLRLEMVRQLRGDLLAALAARDPQTALDALAILSGRNAETGESIFADDAALELSLVERIAAKDPKRAFELAEKNLNNALGSNLFSALESIHAKDADLGSRLARDILARIKSGDTRIVSQGDYMSNSMSSNSVSSGGSMSNGVIYDVPSGSMSRMSNTSGSTAQGMPFVVNVWEIQQFAQSVKKLNRQAAKDKKTPALTDGEVKDLIGVLAQKYVKQPNLSPYEVAAVMTDIAAYFPASAQAIRAKLSQGANADELENQIRSHDIQSETTGKTAQEIFETAEKKPVAEREKFYRAAAERAVEEGDFARAKDFYGRVKGREDSDYLGAKIEEGMPLALAQTGDMRAVRQTLAKLKTPEQRIEILSALAQSIAQNGDKKIAASLLGEARAQYSGRLRQRRNLNSLLQMAQAYAVVDANEGFALLEGNLSYFNDLIAAGILIDDFNYYGSVKSDEVNLDDVRAESYRSVPNGVALIKKLAVADFDRTVALAERFARPETAFFARFRIVEALLDPDAEKTEKQIRESEEREID